MPTCYVTTPFGRKRTPSGREVDFDQLYQEAIKPAVLSAGYECFRGDELKLGGLIPKAVMSALLSSDVVVADVSTHHPDVLYEVGVRHSTGRGAILLFQERLPFDLQHTPAIPYSLSDDSAQRSSDMQALRTRLADAIRQSEAGHAYSSPMLDYFPELHVTLPRKPCVFIGHGRSPLWARVQTFLERELKLETDAFEAESRTSESIISILEKMMAKATFAVIVLTAEDETAVGSKRARQNVVHEVGLFQGALGFHKVVVLKQDKVEEFSNIAGLQHIAFTGDDIHTAFYELQRVLKREKVLAASA